MKVFWYTIGVLALILGGLGVVLPVLPTTPFVILAAFAFGKSSPRLRQWLLDTKLFGPMIKDWEAHGAIPSRVKLFACLMMAGVFFLSVYGGAPTTVLAAQAIGPTASFLIEIMTLFHAAIAQKTAMGRLCPCLCRNW